MATTANAASTTKQASQQGKGNSNWQHDWRWLVAWAMLILLLVLINRFRWGQVVTYYALALMLVFLIVTQFRFFADALAPFTELGPGLTASKGPQGETRT
jgi:cobalamin synthase